jgi:hypothetical protein
VSVRDDALDIVREALTAKLAVDVGRFRAASRSAGRAGVLSQRLLVELAVLAERDDEDDVEVDLADLLPDPADDPDGDE